jgi:hypothetical protein
MLWRKQDQAHLPLARPIEHLSARGERQGLKFGVEKREGRGERRAERGMDTDYVSTVVMVGRTS